MDKANCIEFYFDCSSPWTYLAFTEILPLSQRQNLQIIWKPVLVGGIFNSVNKDVYKFRENPNPLKLNYANNDLILWAKVREIDISLPKNFPINSVKAMRGCLFAIQENCLQAFAKNIFEAYWGHHHDISEDAVILSIAVNTGLDAIKFKKFIESSEAKKSLIENSEELIAKGGFGSPTFFYKDKMFFGNDRLTFFEECIKKGYLE